jgi:2-polyprenyl-6-methoxyphenol hydroxylase-like FAD-dependent oxidoreductase
MSQPQHRILIIGAGLAGLGLAQGLKKSNISFHIFERDSSAGFRAQGYRIRIGPHGAAAIKRLLPERLWEAFEATAAEVVHGGSQLDVMTGERSEFMGGRRGPPEGWKGGRAYNIDRAVVREVLLRGLEGSISFGKKVERFEVVEGEGVRVWFADGSCEMGSFLVGADGIRSVVRKQLIPEMVVLDTEGRAVFGKTVLSETTRREMHPLVGQGITVTAQTYETRIRLFCDGMRFDREAAEPFEKGLDIQLPPDYIYWVLVFRSDMVSPEEEKSLLQLTDEQSAQLSINMTSTWNEQLRAVVKHQKVDAASTLAFLTASQDFASSWSSKPANTRSCVTLIGDSAHPAPPVGGIGANAGFQDAADLCDTLARYSAATEEHERAELVAVYEEKMLERAKSAVEKGMIGGGHFFGMKPVSELRPATIWH